MKRFLRNLVRDGRTIAFCYVLSPVHISIAKTPSLYSRTIYVFGVRIFQQTEVTP